jgi:hypothetical protein
MGESFVVDIDKAQQVGEKLTSITKEIESFPPGPKPSGPLGTGSLERAWSQFESNFATARQNLAKSVSKSGQGFSTLARAATQSDQQQAQQAREIGTSS